jgi:hypothetical protein
MSWSVTWMVLGIVLITAIASVLRARMGIRKDRHGNELPMRDDAEVQRMREETKALKERVAVLERIATERNHSLEHEIERLRDR